jgi:predicted nucleotidyltransferase component of viral defense system
MRAAERYAERVALLVRVLPLLTDERDFALKGGTAINLFHRGMPRLSVDLDLTFLPVADRETSLDAIDVRLRRIATAIEHGIPGSHARPVLDVRTQTVTKVIVQRGHAQVKLEVTPVLRGCVYAPEFRDVHRFVEDRFGYARAQLVSFPDLYAGKLVAALDRQHPRDLFDVRELLANEGIDERTRQAFLAYLISHDRPIAEVLEARPKDLRATFRTEFEGMTSDATTATVEDLIAARTALVHDLVAGMPRAHRAFLIGFKRGEPDWGLTGVPQIRDLPAVRWKQANLDRMTPSSRARAVERLEALLGLPHR